MAALAADLEWALSLGTPKEPKNIAADNLIGSLGTAVLIQTHDDATRAHYSRPGGWTLTLALRREALEFAFSPDEEITATRVYFCGQAGIHPDKLRRIIIRDIRRLLAGGRKANRTGVVEALGSPRAAAGSSTGRPQQPRGPSAHA